jgi:superoxide oxidase
VVRILIRIKSVVPPIVPAPSAKEEKVAVLMHVALYGFMLCMPILGWLIISSHGNSVPFWGIHLPALMGENKELHEIFHEMHEVGATIGYLLIGLHAVAGLLHHYKLKDNTLIRISFLKDKSK